MRLKLHLFAFLTTTTLATGDGPMAFKITAQKPDDSVEVRTDRDRVSFLVKSASGIGHAAIERNEKEWPKSSVLRLYLRGLDFFQVANEKVKLRASVSIQTRQARVWEDGKENAPLDSKSPLWMEIRTFTSDGKLTTGIPLKAGGYFEMNLPPAFFEGQPKAIELDWIDFFRN